MPIDQHIDRNYHSLNRYGDTSHKTAMAGEVWERPRSVNAKHFAGLMFKCLLTIGLLLAMVELVAIALGVRG